MEENVKTGIYDDKIKISEEVIATIAGIAASETENMAAMSGGIASNIAGMLGKKSMSKGIKVELNNDEVTLDLSLIIQYGAKIHEVARKIQQRVRNAVEEMTGLKVVTVNVNVIGLNVEKDSKKVEVAGESQTSPVSKDNVPYTGI